MTRVPPPPTRSEVQADLAARLGSPNEARWLVEQVLGRARSGDGVDPGRLAIIEALADRRRAGEPLQYVLGSWAFRTLEMAVDRRALIPRPETEQVVEVALAELRRLAGRTVVDLGTGSGVIGLSIAVEAGARVWASDADADALALATENLARAVATRPDLDGRVTMVAGHWFEALPDELRGRVDLVVANPPYVAEAEWAGLQSEVHQEPRRALVAGDGSDGTPGLADVEAVLSGAMAWLGRPGAVVVELAPHQAEAAVRVAEAAGFGEVSVCQDLAGRDRAVVGRI